MHCEDVTLAAQGYAWQPPNRLLEDEPERKAVRAASDANEDSRPENLVGQQ